MNGSPRIPQFAMGTLPPWVKGPWISLQAPPLFRPFSGTYVPIYMLKRLYDAADPSKGGSFVIALVKGPVPEQMEDVLGPTGSSVSYTTEFFGGGYPPRIKPPATLVGAPAPRDIRREPVLIVTFSITGKRTVKVDLSTGLAISTGGPQRRPAPAMPVAVFMIDSFEMDAEAWYRATCGVQQKLTKVGQITLLQDFGEMRDLRDALTLRVLRGPKNLDFSGGYVAVRYSKEVSSLPGGGARISVVLLNKARGGPSSESMVQLEGQLVLYDPRFLRVQDTRFVPTARAIKAGSPVVALSLSIDSRGLVRNVVIALMRVNTDMTLSDPVAVLNLNGASWEAAAGSTCSAGHGAGVVVSNNGMQFEVRASRAVMIR